MASITWGLVDGIHLRATGGLGGERHVFVVAQVAVGLELHDLALILEGPIHRLRLRLEHLLDDGLGIGVGPTDSVEQQLFLLRLQLDPGLLERLLQRALECVEVVR